VSLSDAHKIMTIVLYPNMDRAQLNMTLQAKTNGSIVLHQFTVAANTTGHVAIKHEYDDLVMPEQNHEGAVASADLPRDGIHQYFYNFSVFFLSFF
jgi:hypothetical protein